MEHRSVPFGINGRAPSFGGVLGCARRDITPPSGVRARIWGAAAPVVAGAVHRPLTRTALAASYPGGAGVVAPGTSGRETP